MTDLPVNIDTTYADDGGDASVQEHQAHHDSLHVLFNAIDGATPDPSSLGLAETSVSAVAETTTSRTLALTDAGKVVESTNAAATTITVPPNSAVAFPVGTIIGIYSAGAGGVTLAQGAGVTVRNLANLAQYGETSLRKRGTDEWVQA